ncbi:glycoside hydrolase family 23 protein [Schizophyllum amplum]|uniref:Glycoside hydrolase family 23 protein n=1 Tax=Schizophyllum amplum TaxID=97359 RepID=A0A550CZY8_9AGAR|nr:glycoside hydrolase family 23 protein [Auriculariopsis ampla]
MKLALVLAAISACALAHDGRGALSSGDRQEVARHMRLAKKGAAHYSVRPIHGSATTPSRRSKTKRQCRQRDNVATATPSPSSSSAQAAPTESTNVDWAPPDQGNQKNNNQDWSKPPDQASADQGNQDWSQPVAGLIKVATDAVCGASGATSDISATGGPNGKLDWLNCGLNAGGWSPPYVTIDDVVTVSLSDAVKDSSSPFQACADYVDMFEQYGNENGIPGIMLASFAMQESTCNKNAVGGNGEQGLMQITVDKCGGAPGGDCKEPNFNIRTGAKYFKGVLDDNGGDLLKSIAGYNGWRSGMTFADATAAQYTGQCFAQNNLDYLHQFLNGWCQNVDAYQHNPPLGQYFNLAVCG